MGVKPASVMNPLTKGMNCYNRQNLLSQRSTSCDISLSLSNN